MSLGLGAEWRTRGQTSVVVPKSGVLLKENNKRHSTMEKRTTSFTSQHPSLPQAQSKDSPKCCCQSRECLECSPLVSWLCLRCELLPEVEQQRAFLLSLNLLERSTYDLSVEQLLNGGPREPTLDQTYGLLYCSGGCGVFSRILKLCSIKPSAFHDTVVTSVFLECL